MDKYENLIWLGGVELTTNNGFILKSTDQGVSISCSWSQDQDPDFTVIISEKFTKPLPADLITVKSGS